MVPEGGGEAWLRNSSANSKRRMGREGAAFNQWEDSRMEVGGCEEK